MSFEQRVTAALRDGAARLHVPEPGPAAARDRARRRARHRQVLVAVVALVALAGATFATLPALSGPRHVVVMDGGGDPAGEDAAGGVERAAPALTFEWRDAEGLVGRSQDVFVTADGVYYALSTAPGARFEDFPDGRVPQALYRSADGLAWEVTGLGQAPWVADLGERGGLLYALGTAPHAGGGGAHIGRSGDGGDTWSHVDLPSRAAPPEAAVPLRDPVVTGHLAVGEDVVVAALDTRYPVDTQALFEFAGLDEGSDREGWTAWTPEGLALFEMPGSAEDRAESGARAESEARAQAQDDPVDDPEAPVQAADAAVPDAVMRVPAVTEIEAGPDGTLRVTAPEGVAGEPLHTLTWADMGLDGHDDLAVQELFVSADGSEWRAVDPPFGGRDLRELSATADGFVAVTGPATGAADRGVAELWHSADGLTWEPAAAGESAFEAPLYELGTVGSRRLVGLAAAEDGVRVAASQDGGRSWSSSDLTALLGDRPAEHAWSAAFDTGPLGAAVVVGAVGDEEQVPDFFLLTTRDGADWSVSPVSDLLPDADVRGVSWVAVGRDSLALGLTTADSGDGEIPPSRVVVGTPVR